MNPNADTVRRSYWFYRLKYRAMKLGQHARFLRYAELQRQHENATHKRHRVNT